MSEYSTTVPDMMTVILRSLGSQDVHCSHDGSTPCAAWSPSLVQGSSGRLKGTACCDTSARPRSQLETVWCGGNTSSLPCAHPAPYSPHHSTQPSSFHNPWMMCHQSTPNNPQRQKPAPVPSTYCARKHKVAKKTLFCDCFVFASQLIDCLLMPLLGHTPVFISPLLYMQTMLTSHLQKPASDSFNSLTRPLKMMVCSCSSILVTMG